MSLDLNQRIKCDTCPRCKDTYPGKKDPSGYHFYICGLTGNIVYKKPHRIARYNGKGYIQRGVSGCGLYETVEDALKDMTESERRRYFDEMERSRENDGTGLPEKENAKPPQKSQE